MALCMLIVETTSGNKCLANIKMQWTRFEQLIHNSNLGRVFETNAMEQCSLVVFQFTQVASTDFICPQRPDGRPAAWIVSLCLPDGHQIDRTYHKIKGSNLPRKQTTLWNWPKMLSHDANSIRPFSQFSWRRCQEIPPGKTWQGPWKC